MTTPRPRCPKCDGLLKHWPADVIGPERVTCTLCGWIFERTAPPIPAREIFSEKPAEPATKWIGACPSCKRAGIIIWKNTGTCSRCNYRLRQGLDVYMETEVARIQGTNNKPAAQPNPKEKDMPTHGDCPVCNRKNVNMPGPKCSRCYDRIKNGKDVITGLKLPAPATTAGSAPGTGGSNPLVPSLPSVPKQKPDKQPKTIIVKTSICSVDIMAVIDATWQHKRQILADDLGKIVDPKNRLRQAARVLDNIESI